MLKQSESVWQDLGEQKAAELCMNRAILQEAQKKGASMKLKAQCSSQNREISVALGIPLQYQMGHNLWKQETCRRVWAIL